MTGIAPLRYCLLLLSSETGSIYRKAGECRSGRIEPDFGIVVFRVRNLIVGKTLAFRHLFKRRYNSGCAPAGLYRSINKILHGNVERDLTCQIIVRMLRRKCRRCYVY